MIEQNQELQNLKKQVRKEKLEQRKKKVFDKFIIGLKKKIENSNYNQKKIMKNRVSNASSFINIKEITEDGVLHLKSGEVASLLEVDAVDLSLSSNEEKEIFFRMLRRIYQIQNMTLKCYKLDKPINLNKNRDFLINEASKYSENHVKRGLLETEASIIDNLEKTSSTLTSAYYFVVIANDLIALDKYRQEIQNLLSGMIIRLNTTHITNRLEIYKFLSNLYMTTNSLEQLMWSNLTDLLAPSRVQETQLSLKIEDETIQMVSIKNIPPFIEELFFEGLFNIPNVRASLTIKDSFNQEELVKWIDSQFKFLLADRNTTRKLSDATDLDIQQENYQILMNDIKAGDERIKEVSAVFIITGDKKQREEAYNTLKQVCNFYHIKLDIPKLRQYEAFQCYDLGTKSFLDYAFYLPSKTLTAGFPFTKTYFNDRKGFALGVDVHTGLPIFFDPFTLTQSRPSHNIAVIGTTGAGKSFTMKKLIIDEFARNTKILIFDAENEYKNIIEKNNGEYIDLYSKSGGVINPLQVRYLASEDTETNEVDETDQPLAKHLGFLEVFFKTAFEEITEKELVTLLNICEELYKEKGITKSTTIRQLQSFKPENYPTFTDLSNFIPIYQERHPSEKENDTVEELKLLIQRFLIGNDSFLFNNYTNIDLSNDLIGFNLQELLYSENKRLINTQTLNLLSYINNAIVQNKMINEGKDKDDRKHIAIIVDEFHLFIDEDNPVILKNFGQMARRIRKYSGSLVVTTQSIKDFVGNDSILRHSTAIFNNCQYQLVGMLKESDLLAYLELFKQNPLTETQKEFLLEAQQGEFLLNIDAKNRLRVQIIANDLELELMGEQKRVRE